MRNGLIGPLANPPPTLADVLTGLERNKRLSARRRRRRRSAVFRVARLLGDEPGAIVLDSIGARLANINPVAAGITAKTLANIRSEFLGAVEDSGVLPVKAAATKALTPAWITLFERQSGPRAPVSAYRALRATPVLTASNRTRSATRSLQKNSSLPFVTDHCTQTPMHCTARQP